MNPDDNKPALAIIGIGCRFPKADSLQSYWNNIRDGVDAITDIPPDHWSPDDYFNPDKDAPDMTYARRGGFIDPVDFDPLYYGMSPNNIEATDTTQLLGMAVTRDALLDAGYATGRDSGDGRPFDRDRTSVILGVTGTLELVIPLGARLGHPLWRRALREAGVNDAVADDVVQRIAAGYVPWQENSFPGLLGNVAAGRIANRFDLGGTNCVVDAACASSLSAVHMAAMELYSGRADMAITGGLDTFNDIFMYMCFSKTPALSPTGNSRPFHCDGDGTILGEGLGIMILKRLADARRDGDRIYAVIRGIGSSSDGRGNAIYAPSAGGQQKALRKAYADARVNPGSIELVEAHGTGTRVGDAVEAEALSAVYREDRPEGTWCAIGSVKSMIGHTKAAAGVAGLIKCALALQHKVLPPTIKVERPLDVLQPGAAPVYVNTVKRPWPGRPEHPRRAAVSAFGFGGSNFHAVLEEAGAEQEIYWDGRVLIFAFSGAGISDLQSRIRSIDAGMEWNELRKTAAESLRNYDAGQNCRLILVVERDRTDLAGLFNGALAMMDERPESDYWTTPEGACFGQGPAPGGLALVFPGQGAQYPGMLRDLACQFPQITAALELANRNCGTDPTGKRLSDYIYPIPVFDAEQAAADKAALQATNIAQPAIGAVSAGAARILDHFGIQSDATAGHSFGELTALMYAGVYDETGLYRLAQKRGELMQQGEGDRGAMLAVITTPRDLYHIMEERRLDLIIANHNAPTQLVLSGATSEIERAATIFKHRSIRCSRLPVAAAFHSSFIAAAAKPFGKFIDTMEFRAASIPVYSNTTAQPYPTDAGQTRSLLAGQLAQPVEFVQEIENMYSAGIRVFIEAGPSNIVTGLIGAVLEGRDHHALTMDYSKGKRSGQYDLALLLARISALGFGCDLNKWDEPYLAQLREEIKPALTIPLSGANYFMPKGQSQVTSHKLQETKSEEDQLRTTSHEPRATDHQSPAAPRDFSDALKVTQQGILALQKMQEQTAQLHKQYLEGQEQAQRNIQQLILQQQQILSGSKIPTIPTPITEQVPIPTTTTQIYTESTTTTDTVDVHMPETPDQAPGPSPLIPNTQYSNILLEVVSEKTGYPMDMLSLEMSLDTDLGIDSIKRVEILSALQDRLPGMQQIQPEELGTFQLLQHIVEYLAAEAETTAVPAHTAENPDVDDGIFRQALLEVVAEKTGYPVDMLNLDMHLDADLGIDSIKRVEILSALQDRLPYAPAVQPEQLAELQTLQQIVDYMQGTGTKQPTEPSPEPRAPIEEIPLQETVVRYVVELQPIAPTQPDIDLGKEQLWIMEDGTDMAEGLCRSLLRHGIDARIVPPGMEPQGNVAGLVFLVPEDADSSFIESCFKKIQDAGPRLQLLAGISRLGGGFGINGIPVDASPVAGALAGIIKTAEREWDGVHCKAVDIPSGAADTQLIDQIADELLTAGPVEVGIDQQGARTPALRMEAAAEQETNPFSPRDVIVVSGGARGVTAEVASAMAHSFGVNLLLLGRSPAPQPEPGWLQGHEDEASIKQAITEALATDQQLTPRDLEREYQRIHANREILANINRMEDAGVVVKYASVDIRDEAEVRNTIAEVRGSVGPIAGFIHGAGILADRFISDKTDAQFREVFSTKVDGLDALLRATAEDELKLMVMFSSSTARFGRKGQADYAAANEVLNKTAWQQQQLRPDCRVISINWGPWDGGMVTPALKKLFESEGVGVIPMQAGASYLMQEIMGEGPVEVVVTGSELPPSPCTRAAGEQEMTLAFERTLNLDDFPVLASHVMNGRAVLPLAIIAEWLAIGAMHNNPGLVYLGFDELRTLKGVTLENGEHIELQVMAGRIMNDGDLHYVPVELRAGKTLHARARILLGDDYQSAPIIEKSHVTGVYPHEEIYAGGRLFHGPLLQGITEVDACGPEGITAKARLAPPPAEWVVQPMRSAWLGDPLVMDCAFQMMILWSFESMGTGSLPTCVKGYRQYQRTLSGDKIEITALTGHKSRNSATANIFFTGEDGRLLAEIEGYECVVDDSLNQAFKLNRLKAPSAT